MVLLDDDISANLDLNHGGTVLSDIGAHEGVNVIYCLWQSHLLLAPVSWRDCSTLFMMGNNTYEWYRKFKRQKQRVVVIYEGNV